MKPKPVVAAPESSEEEEEDDSDVESRSEGEAESDDNEAESSDDEEEEQEDADNKPEDNDDEEEDSDEAEDEEDEHEHSQPIPSQTGAKVNTFAIKHVQDLLEDPPEQLDLPYKSALKKIDFTSYASEAGLSSYTADLEKVCRTVVRRLSLKDLLHLAISDSKKYFKRVPKLHKANAYQYFLKDFHAKNGHLAINDRMRMAGVEYKQLTVPQKKKYLDLAQQANIVNGFLNDDGTAKAKAKAERKQKQKPSGQVDLRTLLHPVEAKKDSLPSQRSPKKKTEPIPEMPDLFAKAKPAGKKAKDAESDEEQPVQVNVFNYYSEHLGKGTKEETRNAFSRLTDQERVQLTYKIIQMINERCNQRVVLTKQDQELLDKYEKRPVRPGTAYTAFLHEKHADPTLAHLPYRDRASAIGALWKNLDAKAKAEYERINKQQKKEYDSNHAAFLAKLPPFRREEEVAPKIKRRRKRRASVGESPASDDVFNVRTNSTFLDESKKAVAPEPAKRKQRSKTIDCPSMNIRDFFHANKVQEAVATPVKTALKRKAVPEPIVNGGESEGEEPETVSPQKPKNKKKKRVEVEPAIVAPAPVPAQVEGASPKKSKKKKADKEVPIPVPVESSPKKEKKKKKKTIEEAISEAVTPQLNGFASPKKGSKAPKVKPRETTPPPPTPSPIPDTLKPPKKKNKKAPEPAEEPKEPEKKKKKTKQRKPLTEPVAPPASTKEYFKSIFDGDPSAASKAYKKLTIDQKRGYHEQLTKATGQYVMDLSVYMNSLSGAEVALYNLTH